MTGFTAYLGATKDLTIDNNLYAYGTTDDTTKVLEHNNTIYLDEQMEVPGFFIKKTLMRLDSNTIPTHLFMLMIFLYGIKQKISIFIFWKNPIYKNCQVL